MGQFISCLQRIMKLILLAILPIVLGQQIGHQKEESHLPFKLFKCNDPLCSSSNYEKMSLVLDSNWRWLHKMDDYVNCYEGNSWDSSYCPDPVSCAQNCGLDGIPPEDWSGTYGISQQSDKDVTLKLVTHGEYSSNVGSRMILLDESGKKYKKFNLMNKEFSFDVDVSNMDCGLNGALYLVEMDADGGLSYSGNNAGAEYGTGYCDAQCPHDIKFINGEANMLDWGGSDTDPNSGTGRYGSCCAEMDLWEANSRAQAYTTHPCAISGAYRCEGTECGDNDSGERYDGVCDKDGCDFASYRYGDQKYWGKGSGFTINTETKKITVVTQFITHDGTDNGDLVEVRRFYRANGQEFQNSKATFDSIAGMDSITDEFCQKGKALFDDFDDHTAKGGLKAMGESMKRGMTLILSMWDDHAAHMLWLDSNYPPEGDPSTPGVARGPCPTDSGVPSEVEEQQADATVTWSNIGYGPIGSTFKMNL